MSELKPCPFCGSEQPQDSKDDGNVPYEFGMSRSCNSCSAAVNLGWNTRPIEDALNARIAELEAERRWIPVSEGLPELDQDVFAVVDGELDRGHFYQQWDGEVFFSSNEKGAMMVATHWMPLPTPPEVQE